MTGLDSDSSDVTTDAVMYSSSSSNNSTVSNGSKGSSSPNISSNSNYDSSTSSSSGNTTQEERNPFVPYYLRKDLKYQRTKTKKRPQQKTNKTTRPVVQLMMQRHRQHQQQKNIASALSDKTGGEVQAEMLVSGNKGSNGGPGSTGNNGHGSGGHGGGGIGVGMNMNGDSGRSKRGGIGGGSGGGNKGRHRMPSPDAILRGNSSHGYHIGKKHGNMPRYHHHHHHHHYHHHHTSDAPSSTQSNVAHHSNTMDDDHHPNNTVQKTTTTTTTSATNPTDPVSETSPPVSPNISTQSSTSIISNHGNIHDRSNSTNAYNHNKTNQSKHNSRVLSSGSLPSISELMGPASSSSSSSSNNSNPSSHSSKNQIHKSRTPREKSSTTSPSSTTDLSLSFFQEAFMCLPTAAVVQSLYGEFIAVNTTFMQLTGYSETELIGAHSQDILHPGDVEHFEGKLRTIINKDESRFSILSRFLHRHGGEIPTMIKGVVRGRSEYPGSCLLCSVVDLESPSITDSNSNPVRPNITSAVPTKQMADGDT